MLIMNKPEPDVCVHRLPARQLQHGQPARILQRAIVDVDGAKVVLLLLHFVFTTTTLDLFLSSTPIYLLL